MRASKKIAKRPIALSAEAPDKEAVSPPGWGGTVEHMKDHKDEIGNPWALCLGGDTTVPLLDGTEKTLREMADICLLDSDAVFWVYSFDLAKERICVGRAHHARCTGVRSDLFRVLLDNGREIIATSNHPWLLLDGEYVETAHLQPGTRCMPLYRRTSLEPTDRLNGYEMVLQPRRLRKCGCGAFARPDKEFLAQHHIKLGSRGTYDRAKGIVDSGFLSLDDGYWQYTHKFAAGELPDDCRDGKSQFIWNPVVHHKDFNKANNRPDNLEYMRAAEHSKLHGKLVRKWRDAGIIALREWRLNNPDLYREALIRAGQNSKKGHAGLRRYNVSKKCRSRASHYSASGEQTKDWLKNICARVLAAGMPVTSESWDQHKLVKNAPSFETALKYFGSVDTLIRETETKHGLGVNHKVVSVERVESPMPVYDLTVDRTSNFGIGAGVFVHNSWWMSKQEKPGGGKRFHPRYKEKKKGGKEMSKKKGGKEMSKKKGKEMSKNMLDEIVANVCQPMTDRIAERKTVKQRARGTSVFQNTHSKVNDHFPINDLAHAQNALARVEQYDSVPSWYSGTLGGLKSAVRRAVYKDFPGLQSRKKKRGASDRSAFPGDPDDPDDHDDGSEVDIHVWVKPGDESLYTTSVGSRMISVDMPLDGTVDALRDYLEELASMAHPGRW